MGSGRQLGQGPLPRFLNLAAELSAIDKSRVKLLFICDISPALADGDPPSVEGNPSNLAELVEPFDEISNHATIITTTKGVVPWQSIMKEIGEDGVPDKSDHRFLIVGCQTEERILAISMLLHNMLGYNDVAVCPHLVGSKTQEAHLAALRHNLPAAGIRVCLDLAEAAEFVGLEPDELRKFNLDACRIEPQEVREKLSEEQCNIIQRICMNWTQAHLRPLQGGFSGSLLFLASGWKGNAQTEPMVIKIDHFDQMRRELDGYHRVKDFVGKHVPTFGYPVAVVDMIGVGMELAAMEGLPDTLQDDFEKATDERAASRFTIRLEKAIGLLSDRLYRNTRTMRSFAPYREFLLHTKDQAQWLKENLAQIAEYAAAEGIQDLRMDSVRVPKILQLIAANEDGIEAEICLSHGDLNFKNIICDRADNIWFIDWTHSGEHPIELDFAKLENDVKFVMSKNFEKSDLPRLKKFEAYLIAHRIPADVEGLPAGMQFVKEDNRYGNILGAVIRIRKACFELKDTEDWLIYKIALLKYSLHTLSFDQQSGRGECDVIQLLYAYFSTEGLAFELVQDDYHLRIRGERPPSYPPRQRVSIDVAPWALECPDYDPPYFVEPEVLENDRSRTPGGWADPEDFEQVRDSVIVGESQSRDEESRPLNPRGRTGLTGRGMLGRWGANPAVSAVVTRLNAAADSIEILVGRREHQLGLSLPRGFLFPGESADDGISRTLMEETGYQCTAKGAEILFDEYYYDPRQTDHAWVELRAYFFHPELAMETGPLKPTSAFDEVEWRPLTAATVNDISSSGARSVREAISRLTSSGVLDSNVAAKLLAKTG